LRVPHVGELLGARQTVSFTSRRRRRKSPEELSARALVCAELGVLAEEEVEGVGENKDVVAETGELGADVGQRPRAHQDDVGRVQLGDEGGATLAGEQNTGAGEARRDDRGFFDFDVQQDGVRAAQRATLLVFAFFELEQAEGYKPALELESTEASAADARVVLLVVSFVPFVLVLFATSLDLARRLEDQKGPDRRPKVKHNVVSTEGLQ
jgi:hypothetical protein